ncbi:MULTISPECIES: aldo/keto reductase [unclassified Streptomyces]|uniref:aldo/keto reductase n=1 Tax=unclassified Streptomyces TaxID=2593676 RepID=UPI002E180C75|nr:MULTISPECIES: aldo/keto reductase [unclassified Streptomyces]
MSSTERTPRASEQRRISTVELGKNGPVVGIQGLGCMGMSWAYGPTDADEARATLERALELGVTLVPYSPLGRGFLTGSFVSADKELADDDFRRQQPRFTGDNAAANAALLEPVRQVADAHGASLGQVALAWVQQQAGAFGLGVVPIPGTRKRTRVEENTAATRIVLTDEELALLEPIAAKVSGDRYADMAFTSAGRE